MSNPIRRKHTKAGATTPKKIKVERKKGDYRAYLYPLGVLARLEELQG